MLGESPGQLDEYRAHQVALLRFRIAPARIVEGFDVVHPRPAKQPMVLGERMHPSAEHVRDIQPTDVLVVEDQLLLAGVTGPGAGVGRAVTPHRMEHARVSVIAVRYHGVHIPPGHIEEAAKPGASLHVADPLHAPTVGGKQSAGGYRGRGARILNGSIPFGIGSPPLPSEFKRLLTARISALLRVFLYLFRVGAMRCSGVESSSAPT